MGLDTTHDCWHGSYGSFTRWRTTLARAAGYRISEPAPENGYARYVDLNWDVFQPGHFMGEWNGFVPGDDPLMYLIVHSDCDGVIHPQQGRHIAARLEQLLPKLDDSDRDAFPIRQGLDYRHGSMREATQRFIDGLRAAAAADEDVIFC